MSRNPTVNDDGVVVIGAGASGLAAAGALRGRGIPVYGLPACSLA